jgi:hypothetical protein
MERLIWITIFKELITDTAGILLEALKGKKGLS